MEPGDLCIEFFRYQDLDAGVPEQSTSWPRVHAPKLEHSEITIGYLVDRGGTLLRLVQNEAETS